jgi:hypothetical protein
VPMTEVRAERHKMAGYRSAIVGALLQRADRKSVPKIMDARITTSVSTRQPRTLEKSQEYASYPVVGQLLAGSRNKEHASVGASPVASSQIPIKFPLGRRMQWQQAAFLELGLANQ